MFPPTGPDLTCLDHGYFITEVSRLRERAQQVQGRMLRDAYGCGRQGSGTSIQRQLEGLEGVMATLDSYK